MLSRPLVWNFCFLWVCPDGCKMNFLTKNKHYWFPCHRPPSSCSIKITFFLFSVKFITCFTVTNFLDELQVFIELKVRFQEMNWRNVRRNCGVIWNIYSVNFKCLLSWIHVLKNWVGGIYKTENSCTYFCATSKC